MKWRNLYQRIKKEHPLFELLNDSKKFYKYISRHPRTYVFDSYGKAESTIYESLICSISSVERLIAQGHINDAVCLLRKYRDAVLSHMYICLRGIYLDIEYIDIKNRYSLFSESDFVEWISGQYKLPDNISNKLKDKEKALYELIISKVKSHEFDGLSDFSYANSNVHFNGLKYFAHNVPHFWEGEGNLMLSHELDKIECLFKHILTIHFGLIYLSNNISFITRKFYKYTTSGKRAPDNLEKEVEPIVKDVFQKYVKTINSEFAEWVLSCNIHNF